MAATALGRTVGEASLRWLAWHSPKLCLLLVLITGLSTFDLLHAVLLSASECS